MPETTDPVPTATTASSTSTDNKALPRETQNTDNRQGIKEGIIQFKTVDAKETRKIISQCITEYNGYLVQEMLQQIETIPYIL